MEIFQEGFARRFLDIFSKFDGMSVSQITHKLLAEATELVEEVGKIGVKIN